MSKAIGVSRAAFQYVTQIPTGAYCVAVKENINVGENVAVESRAVAPIAANRTRSPIGLISLFACTIFLSAFLLFQIQLIIAKYILPWFGGTPSTFTTCILFFQVLLLLGYLYAHFIDAYLGPRGQAIIHSALIGLALLALAWRAVDVGLTAFTRSQLEAAGQRAPVAPHPCPSERQCRVALLPGLDHRSLAASLVQPDLSRHSLSFVCSVECRFPACTAFVSGVGRTLLAFTNAGTRLGMRVRRIRPRLCGHRMAGCARTCSGTCRPPDIRHRARQYKDRLAAQIALAVFGGGRVAQPAGNYESYLPGRRGGSAALGIAPLALPAIVHRVLLFRAVVFEKTVVDRNGSGSAVSVLRSLPSEYRHFAADPDLFVCPSRIVHDLPRRTCGVEAAERIPHVFLFVCGGGRRAGRIFRQHHCSAHFQRLLGISSEHMAVLCFVLLCFAQGYGFVGLPA